MTDRLPTVELYDAGQSPWLDNISRDLLKSGKLRQMIQDQGLKGVTSNPAIFQKAISKKGGGYDVDIRKLLSKGKSTLEIYDELTITDIRNTCDLFLPIYKETDGEHGFVSLEVLPNLANNTEKTIEEGLRLHKAVNRPNVMIKVPATPEGIPAIRALIGQGVSVNITLMFSMKHYQDVAKAYIEGLQDFAKSGGDLRKVHSVSSVFVSRVDSYVDKRLDQLIASARDMEKKAYFENLKGKAAIANCKDIYQEFKKIFNSKSFQALEEKGAHIQKVLWGSTSTKDPSYPDLLYVDTLVGPYTVNTMPQVTLDALMDHGDIEPGTIEESLSESQVVLKDLKTLGLDLIQVGEHLQEQGVDAFVEAFDLLMKTLEDHYEAKQKRVKLTKIKYSGIPKAIQKTSHDQLAQWRSANFLSRFFNGDPAIWRKEASHQAVIRNRLGWLRVHEWISGKLYELDQLVESVRADKVKDIILLGMGGSSLAPEVMSLICDRKGPKVRFAIVDTTDPESISKIESKFNLQSTLFIVASKSGGTVETLSQFYYFYDCVSKKYGKTATPEQIGQHFIAITDSGSGLQKLAKEKAFRKTFVNPTDIGGRFSALSFFGMVPAALMGVDVRLLLRYTRAFFDASAAGTNLEKNPAFYLGMLLAQFAKEGKDKLALYPSKKLASFSSWQEQLIAESTGKQGEGIIPIDGEAVSAVSNYGDDRVFIVSKLKGESSPEVTKATKVFKQAGYPLVEIEWPAPAAIGEAFLFWEMVTAVAGAALEINPFDEPNVKESKDITKKILGKFEKTGKLDAPKNILKKRADYEALFGEIKEGSYVGLLAYIERTPQTQKAFNAIRKKIQQEFKVPVLLGFGPRYLHSIGQLYKGGPKKGVFLEFVKKESKDVQVPGQKYQFGQLKMAQALGDFEAIASKKIPVATVDLGKNSVTGIAKFEKQLFDFLKKRK